MKAKLVKEIGCISFLLFVAFVMLNQSCKLPFPQKQINIKTNPINNLKINELNQNLTKNKPSWANLGLSVNKLQKIINGNRRSVGYKLAVWNCGRGLIKEGGFSVKLLEIKQFIEAKKPHCFGIIESDFYGLNSHINRMNKYTTEEIKQKLKIDGYKIELPKTWDTHGQARIFCYVSEDIKYSRKYFDESSDHIPSITLEIGLGRATKTTVHYYYREWKNGVTGESDNTSQLVHLKQHINQWDECVNTGRNCIALGDANLCALSWNESSFKYKELSNEVQTFLLSESCFQLVNKNTRVQEVAGRMQRSCLDHITTNVPEKCSVPEVFSVGSSDHLPVIVTKFSCELKSQPKTIKKRNYRNFSVTNFLNDINTNVSNGSFDKVINNQSINEASAIFSGVFGSILNRQAPLKVFQVRNNYSPWLPPETMQMINARDELKDEAIKENCPEKYQAYKRLRNRVNLKLPEDEKNHYKSKFYEKDPSTATLWRNSNDYLNTSKGSYNNTPNIIKHNGRTYTTPRDIANAMNETFLNKVQDLRAQVSDDPEIEPKERLRQFLDKRENEISQLELKKISKTGLRKLLKKRKENRSSGIDFIDGYSIKLAAPFIEDILLHLVNLTIENSEFPSLWKVNKVSPQFKKGDKTVGENWRPVTDIVYVSKLAKAAVFEQVSDHFSKKTISGIQTTMASDQTTQLQLLFLSCMISGSEVQKKQN